MSYLRLLGNPLTLLVITLSLCVAVRNRFDPRHSFQVQAQAPTTATPTPSSTATPTPSSTATPTPSSTATPTPSSTATPTPSSPATPTPSSTPSPSPLPSSQPPGYVNKDNNPLILLKGQWWKRTNTSTSQEVYALSFDKLNNLNRGKLTILYKDTSGISSEDAEYELVTIDNKNSNVKGIDIFTNKDKVIRTIFQIEIDKVKGRILQIQLNGLKQGEGRPYAITPEGVKSFSAEYYSP